MFISKNWANVFNDPKNKRDLFKSEYSFFQTVRVENYLRFKYWRKHMKNYQRNDSSPLNIKS